MEQITLGFVVEVFTKLGPVGLVIILWWYDNRRVRDIVDKFMAEQGRIMAQYASDMHEQRKMYDNNVSLCKDLASVAQDLRAIVILNTQEMTGVKLAVNTNQFCPIQRVEKKSAQIGG